MTHDRPRKTSDFPSVQAALDTVGAQMREARLARNYTIAEVARRATLGKAVVTRIEQGQPGVSVEALIRVLNVLELTSNFTAIASRESDPRRASLMAAQLPQRAGGKGAWDTLDPAKL